MNLGAYLFSHRVDLMEVITGQRINACWYETGLRKFHMTTQIRIGAVTAHREACGQPLPEKNPQNSERDSDFNFNFETLSCI